MRAQREIFHTPVFARKLLPVVISAALAAVTLPAHAATITTPATDAVDTASSKTGDTITVTAAQTDFKAGGETPVPAYLDGDVANGGRLGVLGQQDAMNVPFNVISFTNKLIQDQQSRTLGDVLNNDASVQTGYGYGNYAETFNIRGFALDGEDISYGGLYGVLPRQLVPMELAERVELLKGSSAFLNGVPPGGTGVGGNVNIEPKRATDTPVNRVTVDYTSSSQVGGAVDVGRRFGDNNQWGVRVNAVNREGETAVNDEHRRLTMGSVGLDYRGDRFRSSFDFGVTKQTVHGGRPVVYLGNATKVPDAPSATKNYGQDFASSNLENEFGMLKAEYDVADDWTVYGAVGMNHDREYGNYSSPTLKDDNGNATMGRLTVPYVSDSVATQAGVRGKFDTGFISHSVNLGMSSVYRKYKTAYTMSASSINTNIYDPVDASSPATLYAGGSMGDPALRNRVQNVGVSVSDTLSMLDDRLQLIAGLRRQNVIVKDYSYTGTETDSFEQMKVTPAFGLVVKPWEHVSFYANHIEALQAGEVSGTTYNGKVVTNGGQASGIETSKQDEVGVKTDFGRIAGTLSLYQIKKPVGMYRATGETYEYGTYGEVRNRGVELNVFGEPVLGVRLNGSVTWMNPEMTQTQDGAYNGKDAVGIPRYQWVLGGEWDIPGGSGVTALGKVIRSGSQYADEENSLKVDGWTRLDLGLRYVMPVGQNTLTWRASLENVTNEKYWASATGGYLTQGDPREFKLSATYDF